MFILQMTTAIALAFLAVLAYSEVCNRLAKGKSRKKHLEVPGSPTLPVLKATDTKPHVINHGVAGRTVASQEEPVNHDLEAHKQLYYKLHNLEHYAEILPECRELLLSLLSSTLTDALNEPESGILSVEKFSRSGLDRFLKAKDANVTNRWEEYLVRRRAGALREMFSDKTEAKWWLKQAAPVKYVDGAWLGHINKISTPFKYRDITKNAWQVMSEELGDGDLAKNHVHVYRDLMSDIEAGLPAADSEDFIHPRHELTEARCWTAALAQLLISLFPHDFLPEALGFNMAYESLPLHLLKTVKELREVGLNPYYFELHISIDNADSGHAAMAMSAVANYIDMIELEEGKEVAHVAWKRVQAGYILAEGLPTTPESPSLKTSTEVPFPRTGTEAAVVDIFAAKSFVAHKIHCNSRLRIGRRSLVEWLEPTAFKDASWQKEFIHDLSNCRPWIIKGDSLKSRLIRELSWEGKMFGSFTEKEVDVVRAWIDDLGKPMQIIPSDATPYLDFTKRQGLGPLSEQKDILIDYPVLTSTTPSPTPMGNTCIARNMDSRTHLRFRDVKVQNLLSLWFTSCTVLESLPSVPVRASDTFGSALVRVLRAQAGFDIEGPGVAGMDEVRRTNNGQAIGIVELGFEMCQRMGVDKPKNIREAASLGDEECIAFAGWMMRISMHWLTNRDMLVGMAWAFMELHEMIAEARFSESLLGEQGQRVLRDMAARERNGLEVCRMQMKSDGAREVEFRRGYDTVHRALETWWPPFRSVVD